MRPVTELVRRLAGAEPGALAVVDAGGPAPATWTWSRLHGHAGAVAAHLAAVGVRPGEAVAVQLPNQGDAVVAALGVLRAGAVCCSLPATLGARETARALAVAGARVLVTTGAPAAEAEHVVTVERGRWPALDGTGTAPGGARSLGERSGQLAFTSGTTGEAKPVLHSAGTLARATRMAAARLGVTARDRVLVACPLGHHSGFLYGTWLALAHGCAQVLHGGWDPGRALAAVERWGVTLTTLAPPMLRDLVGAVEAGAGPPRGLRACVVTGAPVDDRLAERAGRVLGAAICRAWGSTETCMATLVAPTDPAPARWATDGHPLDGVRARVTGDGGRPLPPGREGRLEITSPCLFAGYGTGPPFDRSAFTADGWYRPGDLATIDAAGRVRVSGRESDVVNRGGVKVPVRMVEALLSEHGAVSDVAVTAVPDPRLGERACAFAVLVPGHELGLDDVRRFLDRRGVTRSYWPERLEIVASLPRDGTGKVRKAALRRSLERTSPAEGSRTDA